MNRTIRFYEEAFDAKVVGEVPRRDDHPWMKIVDVGGGTMLNVFESSADDIIGERRSQGHRGAVDHFAFSVDTPAVLEELKDRLVKAGAQEVGEVQQFGPMLHSLFFRDVDGLELEVCCSGQ
jgi:catechol 2,3-dioxygenase-like lactoylglutathione lyase family enzyme